MFRRFDAVVEYTLPAAEVATRVMKARLGLLDASLIEWSRPTDVAVADRPIGQA